jgi:hypothetical protein
MAGKRRNQIGYQDAVVVAVLAAVSGVLAVFSGNEPTGNTAGDIVLTAGLAAFVTWAAASAPWWALLAGGGITLAAGLWGPAMPLLLSVGAIGIAAWIGSTRHNQPVARAVAGAFIVHAALRLADSPFFLATALVAAAAMGLVAIAGVVRRRKHIRRRVYIGAAAVGVLGIVGVGLFGFAASQARSPLTSGYQGLRDGLEFVEQGDTERASAVLYEAAAELAIAGERLDSPMTTLAGFVPGVAQNRSATTQLVDGAIESAEAAARALRSVELDRLRIVNGRVDLDAFEELAPPLADLDAAVTELAIELIDASLSPWLVPPLQTRLDDAIGDAVRTARQARAISETARLGPALLGGDGERRYFLAFVNPGEARGVGGLMGNWSELTIEDGQLDVSVSGRSARLQTADVEALELDMSDEFFGRYTLYGARGSTGGTDPKFWSNATAPAHMPDAGSAMAQMYEAATGRIVDGVIVVDPAGLAALLAIAGPIEVPGVGTIDSRNAEQFLLVDQYEFEEAEREDFLEAVTDLTVDRILSTTLPGPQELVQAMAPAALQGNLSTWLVEPAEQSLIELVGMDNNLPVIDRPGTDGLAVVTQNAGGNKIDSFLQRDVEYRATVDEATGDITATVTVTLINDAPTSGYPDYVIGNIVGFPTGTNFTITEVYTPLDLVEARIDGEVAEHFTAPEHGYQVHLFQHPVEPGATSTIVLELTGNIGAGDYRLLYRPQALPNPDGLTVAVDGASGGSQASHRGGVERRSVLHEDSVDAWRAREG